MSDLENQKIRLAEYGEYGTGRIDGVHKQQLNSALGVAGDDERRAKLLAEQKRLKKLQRSALKNKTNLK